MTSEEAIKHITTWLYAAPDVPPMQVVQALELAVAALRAGGTDMNVPTMPAGQPLTLEQLRGMDGKPVWITDLLACAETSEERCKELEERCKRLNEARERANEAAAKWESMYHVALERAEKEEIARKQRNVMVCPVCQGRGRVHTSFYGYGNCTMEDVRNDKFPTVCHCCRGKGILQVNEMKEE